METKTYAKLVDGQLITTCANDDEIDLIEQIRADGFKLYDEDAGQPNVGKFQRLNPVYHEEIDKISLWWEIVDADPEKIIAEIERLDELLSATDYKIVKSFEYSLAGEKIPYDLPALHADRQALRDQINELKSLLDPDDTRIDTPELKPPSDVGSVLAGGKGQ